MAQPSHELLDKHGRVLSSGTPWHIAAMFTVEFIHTSHLWLAS